MNPQERQFLQQFIATMGRELGDLIARLAGDESRLDYIKHFNSQVEALGLSCMDDNKFTVSTTILEWESARAILEQLISFAAKFAGDKLVEKEVRLVMKSIQSNVQTNLYEVFFRLGIHKYHSI